MRIYNLLWTAGVSLVVLASVTSAASHGPQSLVDNVVCLNLATFLLLVLLPSRDVAEALISLLPLDVNESDTSS